MKPSTCSIQELAVKVQELPWASRGAEGLCRVSHPRTDDSLFLLQRVSRELEQAAKPIRSLVISPPRGSADTGSVALTQVAVGLMEQGLADGPVSRALHEPRPWGVKLAAVETALAPHADSLVLLLNEPQTWATQPADAEETQFGQHAAQAAELLLGSACRKVLVEPRPSSASVPFIDVAAGDRAEELLESAPTWGSLAPFARQVRSRYGTGTAGLSELELRLLVGWAAVQQGWPANLDDPFQYIRQLGDELHRPRARDLRAILTQLTLLRGTFGDSLLQRLGADRLGQPWRDMLRFCLLGQTDKGWLLPSVLRRLLPAQDDYRRPQSGAEEMRQAHAEIARYYVQEFHLDEPSRGPAASHYLPNLEAFHHAVFAGDHQLALQRTLLYPDQLDVLGKALSQAGQYDGAVNAFQRSLEWDQENDYAHHYWAYNLDVQGKDRRMVEEHYRKAIGYAPGKAWWWSRWICFLITVGRTDEAEREWGEALSALGLNGLGGDHRISIYFHLHSWVARLLLHRGQLPFAKRVLGAIPPEVYADDAQDTGILARLRTHWLALREAQRNRTVLPVFISPERWWESRPAESICEPSVGGMPIRQWYPGRIDDIAGDNIAISLGTPPAAGATEGDVQVWNVTRAEFDRLSGTSRYDLRAGRFIELVYYGDEPQPRLFLRPEEKHGLPPVRPDPDRYLAQRWKET